MLWLDDGWSYERVSAALFINEGTVRNWRNHYLDGGLDQLSTFDWQGGQSRLTQAQEVELTEHLDQKRHHDCKSYCQIWCMVGVRPNFELVKI